MIPLRILPAASRLAKLFRENSESEIALLGGKFRRMLFLTATPFQLGHHELIQVLRTFGAVLWMGERAASGTFEDFHEKIKQLAEALDINRLAGPTLTGLLKFAGCMPDMPADFAEQHDHYIHGTPRR
jgi:hypothetical protein